MQQVTQTRVVKYDLMRSACAIWIVAFWHMNDYGSSIIKSNNITAGITYGVLATFFYLSGRFTNNTSVNAAIAVKYLLHRMKKMYPLYLLGIFTLLPLHYSKTIHDFIKAILCLQVFFPEMIYTLWFMEVLFILYIFSSLLRIMKNRKRKIGVSILVFMVLLLEHYVWGQFDERLLRYYPFFLFGYFVKVKFPHNRSLLFNFTLAGGCLLISLGLWECGPVMQLSLRTWLSNVSFISFLSILSQMLSLYNVVAQVGTFFASISMFTYLLHRQIYFIIMPLYKGPHPVIFSYCVAIPCLFAFSWFAKIVYEKIVGRVQKIHGILAGSH